MKLLLKIISWVGIITGILFMLGFLVELVVYILYNLFILEMTPVACMLNALWNSSLIFLLGLVTAAISLLSFDLINAKKSKSTM